MRTPFIRGRSICRRLTLAAPEVVRVGNLKLSDLYVCGEQRWSGIYERSQLVRWPFGPATARPEPPQRPRRPRAVGAEPCPVLAQHAGRVRSRRALLVDVGKALLLTLLAALAVAPLAVVWGISHAQVDDYLGHIA